MIPTATGTQRLKPPLVQLEAYKLYDDVDLTEVRGGEKGLVSQAGHLTSRIRAALSHPPEHIQLLKVKAHSRALMQMMVLRGSRTELATCSLDGRLRIWSIVTGAMTKEFESPEEELRAMCLRPTTGDIIVGTGRGRLLTFSLRR